jgi:hypothetical protein
MVKLNQSDERLFGELREALEKFLRMVLSPLTERFAPLDVILRKLLATKLGNSAIAVRVAVLGPKASGKSSFVNALIGRDCLPEDTTDEIVLHPGKEDQPVLRTAKGKTIAIGAAGVRKHLVDERSVRVPELMSRALHARVLENGEFYAAVWEVADTLPTATAICPKLSSVASRIYAPNEFCADIIYYCVDARLMGTRNEPRIFDNLITLADDELGEAERDESLKHRGGAGVTPVETRKRLLECVVFVITHTDAITDFEECLTNIHIKSEPPALKTIQEVYDRLCDIIEDAFHQPVSDSRVLLMNCEGAFMAKNLLRRHSTATMAVGQGAAPMPKELPTVQELYEYSERMFGSAFMQKIDEMSLHDLQRLVVHHAWSQSLAKTGAQALDQTVAIMDFNIVRHLMTSVAVASSEAADTLATALMHGIKTLEAEHESAVSQVRLLESELAWAHKSIDSIQTAMAHTMSIISATADRVVEHFFGRRLDELQYILEHKGLEWFMSRQTGVVVDMKSALNKLEVFNVRYLQQRRYLHDKMSAGQSIGSGRGGTSSTASSDFNDSLREMEMDPEELRLAEAAARPSAASEFVANNMDLLLSALENDRREQLMPLFVSFGHHLRDEVMHALGDFKQEIDQARMVGLASFKDACTRPVTETMKRVGNVLDLDEVLEPLRSLVLLEPNSRRLNNFVRELPEHVASAAIGIATDEYQRMLAEDAEAADFAEEDSERAASDAASSRQKSTWRSGGASRIRVSTRGLPEPGTPDMRRHLNYVLEAWRIALLTVSVDQLATFRYNELAEGIGSASAQVVEFLGTYAGSISDGLEEHRLLVQQITLDREEAVTKVQAVGPFLREFDRIRSALVDVNATDNADVNHVRLVERHQMGMRRRSFDSMASHLPRRRASMTMRE